MSLVLKLNCRNSRKRQAPDQGAKFGDLKTPEQIARYLNINKFTVYRLVTEKKIPAFKVGNQWRFKQEMIDAWVMAKSNMRNKKSIVAIKGFATIASGRFIIALHFMGGSMAEQTVRGSCLCKSVRYEVSTPFARFGHCYCSRCRKATGGVRSTNIAVPIAQFRWTQGEELVKRFDLPEAKSFARQICSNCNCPVPHASRDGQRAIVPAGTLDDVPPGKPAAHGHWSSRVSWVEINESNLPCTD